MDAVNGRPYICIGGVDAKVKIYDVVDGRLVEVGTATVRTRDIGLGLKGFIL